MIVAYHIAVLAPILWTITNGIDKGKYKTVAIACTMLIAYLKIIGTI